MFTNELVEHGRAERLFTVDFFNHLADYFLNGIEISFRFQRVGYPIKLSSRQLGIVVLGIVLVMFEADG